MPIVAEADQLAPVRRIVVRNPLEPQRRLIELLPIAGRTVAEAFPEDISINESWLVLHNGCVVDHERFSTEILGPHDELLITPKIQKSALTKAIVGFVLPPLGVYYGLRALGLNETVSGLLVGGFGGGLGAVVGFGAYSANRARMRQQLPLTPAASSQAESPTYGFQNIQNSTQHGAPIPVVYGVHRVGGQIVNAYVKTQNDTDTLYLLVAVSEGQISNIEDIEINGQPLANFTGVTAETRTGTSNQAPIFMLAGESTTFYSVDLQVSQAGYIYQTQSSVTGVEVKITCPSGLYYAQPADGSLMSWVAPILIEIRKPVAHGGTGTWYQDAAARPSAAQRSPVRRLYRLSANEGPGIYEIRVSRTAPESTNQYQMDMTFWEGINEIVGDRYAYPNVALVGIKALATNQLSGGLPTITSRVTGRFVRILQTAGVHTWSATEQWSETPAWIVLDLLTHTRYGFGHFCWPVVWDQGTLTLTNGSASFSLSGAAITAGTIRRGMKLRTVNSGLSYIVTIKTFDHVTQTGTLEESFPGGSLYVNWRYAIHRDDLDLTSFVQWAFFTETLVTNPQGVTTKRSAVNVVLDTAGAIWDTAQQVAQLGMATLVKVGTYIYARVEQPDDPVQVFTMGNIVQGSYSQSYQSIKDRVNILTGDFRNAEKRYENDFVMWEDADLVSNREQPRREQLSLAGVTNYAIAARLLRRAVNKNRLLRRTITFETGLEFLRCQPFDVILVQHDIPQWGFGSRCAAASTTSVVQLDRSVTLEHAKTYSVLVRFNATDAMEVRAVTTGPSTTSALAVTPPFSTAPQKDDVWAFGEVGLTGKPFRILSIERTPDLNAKITAIEYVTEVYVEIDPDDVVLTNYSQLPDVHGPPGPVKNLTLSVMGNAWQSVWVGFEPPGSINFREAHIYRELGPGNYTYLGRSSSGSFAIEGIAAGEYLVVRVTSVATNGSESSIDGAPRASLLVSFAVTMPTGLNVVYESDAPYLIWNHVQWHRQIWYEVRRGNTWESGIFVAQIPGGINRASIATNGTYWVAVLDDTGSWSEASDPLDVSIASLEEVIHGTLIHRVEFPDPITDWDLAGFSVDYEPNGLVAMSHSYATIDDVGPPENIDEVQDIDTLRISGVKFKSLEDIDAVSDIDLVPDIDSLGGGYQIYPASGIDTITAPALVFPDGTEAVVSVRMHYAYTAESPIVDIDDVPDIDDLPDIDMEWAQYVTVTPLIAVTTLGTYSAGWQSYVDGDYKGWVFAACLRLGSSTTYVTPVVTSWVVEMATKQRGVQQAAADVPASGLRLIFSPPYVAVPTIQATLVNAPEGAELDITEQTTSGAIIRIRVEGLYREGTVNYSVSGR